MEKMKCEKCGIEFECEGSSPAFETKECFLCHKDITYDLFALRGMIANLPDIPLKTMMGDLLDKIETKINDQRHPMPPKKVHVFCAKIPSQKEMKDMADNLMEEAGNGEGEDYFDEPEEPITPKATKRRKVKHFCVNQHGNKFYSCNPTVNASPDKMTTVKKNVTCKNCLKTM